jgi:hypothetical protein
MFNVIIIIMVVTSFEHYPGIHLRNPVGVGSSNLPPDNAKLAFEEYLYYLTRPKELPNYLDPRFAAFDAGAYIEGLELELFKFGYISGVDGFARFRELVARTQRAVGAVDGTLLTTRGLRAFDRFIRAKLREQGLEEKLLGEAFVGAFLIFPSLLTGEISQPPPLVAVGYPAFAPVAPADDPEDNLFDLLAINVLYRGDDGKFAARVGVNLGGKPTFGSRIHNLGPKRLTVPGDIRRRVLARWAGEELPLPQPEAVVQWIHEWAATQAV